VELIEVMKDCFFMDKEKIKLIIRNLESLVECLKSEIDSDEEPYRPQYGDIVPHISDYDEVFDPELAPELDDYSEMPYDR